MNKRSTIFSLLLFRLLFIQQSGTAQQADITHQIIHISPDWQQEQLHGSTQISLKMLESSKKLVLDGEALNIKSIRNQEGEALSFILPEKGKIEINLGRKYAAGQSVDLMIDYHTTHVNETDPLNIWGSKGKGVRFFEPSATEPERQRQIWTIGGPEGNRLWFPSNHSPSDFRTSEVFITLEKPLKAISNGVLKEVRDNGNGTQTFHWKTEVAHAPQLTSFVAGRYLAVTQQYNDVAIRSYCYPHEADATAATAERLPDMMRYFSEITGVAYPYPSYSQVFVQELARWHGNLMTTTVTENMVDDYVTHKDFLYTWDIVESEALASQWFGAHLSPKRTADIWLTNAFARHLAGLYNEYKNTASEYLTFQYSPQQSTYLSDWAGGTTQPLANQQYEDATTYAQSNHVLLHGASVLHMLRQQLGDDTWFEVIRKFTTTYAGKAVSTEDFQKTAEAVSGKSLNTFFRQWVYGVGHPVFAVSKAWNAKTNTLSLKVDQLQQWDTLKTDHTVSSFYAGKMDIELGPKVIQVEIEAQAKNSYEFNLEVEPDFVNFDFENGWVKELQYEQSTEEWLSILMKSKDIMAKVAAMSQLNSALGKDETSETDKERIRSVMRSVILAKESFWRLKMRGIWQLQASMLDAKGELKLDSATETMLLEVIRTEESWVKSSAVWFLGMTRNPKYAELYIDCFEDWSDRVTNAAAMALGKTKSPIAYDALMALQYKPSWKSQSLISALNGLQQLEDPRGAQLALHSLVNNAATHWTLATPIWDHRQAAALTLATLGKASLGHDLIMAQLKRALAEDDLNDIFYNALQVTQLADPRGIAAFDLLKEQFQSDERAMAAIVQLEQQYKSNLK